MPPDSNPDLRESPSVYHVYKGSRYVRETTHDRRAQIRSLIVALQKEVQQLAGRDVHVGVTADVNITITGTEVNHHSYRMRVNTVLGLEDLATDAAAADDTLAADDFESASQHSEYAPAPSVKKSQPLRNSSRELRPRAPSPSVTKNAPDTFDLTSDTYQRPRKRPRRSSNSINTATPLAKSQRLNNEHHAGTPRPHTYEPRRHSVSSGTDASDPDEMMQLLESWRTQWHSQGGWMYDHLTSMSAEDQRQFAMLTGKLDSIQNAIPLANGQVSADLRHIIQGLVPWLEHCRKTAADASQEREEKWRFSSATFHDQARKEREKAEKTILEEIKAQRSLLKKQTKMINRLLESQDLIQQSTAGDDLVSDVDH